MDTTRAGRNVPGIVSLAVAATVMAVYVLVGVPLAVALAGAGIAASAGIAALWVGGQGREYGLVGIVIAVIVVLLRLAGISFQ